MDVATAYDEWKANNSAAERAEVAAEHREEAIDDLLADASWRAANERDAEQWVAGTFDGDHYTEVTLALDALHREGATPAVIERLHRLAKVESEALTAQLRLIAEAQVDDMKEAA